MKINGDRFNKAEVLVKHCPRGNRAMERELAFYARTDIWFAAHLWGIRGK